MPPASHADHPGQPVDAWPPPGDRHHKGSVDGTPAPAGAGATASLEPPSSAEGASVTEPRRRGRRGRDQAPDGVASRNQPRRQGRGDVAQPATDVGDGASVGRPRSGTKKSRGRRRGGIPSEALSRGVLDEMRGLAPDNQRKAAHRGAEADGSPSRSLSSAPDGAPRSNSGTSEAAASQGQLWESAPRGRSATRKSRRARGQGAAGRSATDAYPADRTVVGDEVAPSGRSDEMVDPSLAPTPRSIGAAGVSTRPYQGGGGAAEPPVSSPLVSVEPQGEPAAQSNRPGNDVDAPRSESPDISWTQDEPPLGNGPSEASVQSKRTAERQSGRGVGFWRLGRWKRRRQADGVDAGSSVVDQKQSDGRTVAPSGGGPSEAPVLDGPALAGETGGGNRAVPVRGVNAGGDPSLVGDEAGAPAGGGWPGASVRGEAASPDGPGGADASRAGSGKRPRPVSRGQRRRSASGVGGDAGSSVVEGRRADPAGEADGVVSSGDLARDPGTLEAPPARLGTGVGAPEASPRASGRAAEERPEEPVAPDDTRDGQDPAVRRKEPVSREERSPRPPGRARGRGKKRASGEVTVGTGGKNGETSQRTGVTPRRREVRSVDAHGEAMPGAARAGPGGRRETPRGSSRDHDDPGEALEREVDPANGADSPGGLVR